MSHHSLIVRFSTADFPEWKSQMVWEKLNVPKHENCLICATIFEIRWLYVWAVDLVSTGPPCEKSKTREMRTHWRKRKRFHLVTVAIIVTVAIKAKLINHQLWEEVTEIINRYIFFHKDTSPIRHFGVVELHCDYKLLNGCFSTLFVHSFIKKQGILESQGTEEEKHQRSLRMENMNGTNGPDTKALDLAHCTCCCVSERNKGGAVSPTGNSGVSGGWKSKYHHPQRDSRDPGVTQQVEWWSTSSLN